MWLDLWVVDMEKFIMYNPRISKRQDILMILKLRRACFFFKFCNNIDWSANLKLHSWKVYYSTSPLMLWCQSVICSHPTQIVFPFEKQIFSKSQLISTHLLDPILCLLFQHGLISFSLFFQIPEAPPDTSSQNCRNYCS